MNVPTRVWFIDGVNGSDTGSGTFGSPFQTPAPVNSVSSPGDWIYVRNDTNGGFILQDNQQLLGQGVPLQLGGTTFVPAASRPTIGSPVSNAINLASDNTIRGLNVDSPGGAGIAGLNVGTLTIDEVDVTASGGSGVDIRNGNGVDVNFDSLTVSNIGTPGLSAVRFDNIGGTVSIAGDTTITDIEGIGFAALGDAQMDLDHGGHLTISNIGSSGLDGVSIDLDPASTVDFDGGLTINSINGGNGLVAQSTGAINIGTNTSRINALGQGIVVVDTQIGPAGMTFQTIQAGPGQFGSDLFNTGTAGGLTILNGSPLNDMYFGGDGDDFLHGGPGADNLNGRLGFDTAIFTGNQAQYNTIVNAGVGNWMVQHIATGDVDTLISIERLQFDDGAIPRPAGKGLGPASVELPTSVPPAEQFPVSDAGFGSTKDTGGTAARSTTAPIDLGTLPAGKSLTVVFDAIINVLPATQTQISNQGTVTADGGISVPTNDPTTAAAGDATVTLVPQVDLEISTIDTVDPVAPATPFSYQVTVTNNGPSTAKDVVITDTLPAGVTWVSDDGSNVAPTAGLLLFQIGDLVNGTTVVWTINVTPNAGAGGTTQSNTAVVSTTTNDTNGANDAVSEDTTFTGANVAPVLAPISNQLSAPAASSHVINLSASDQNNDPLLFTATVTKLEFDLDQLLNLTIHPQGVFENLYGGGEKWVFSPGALLSPNTPKWYYILPGSPERLFEWDETPNALSGTLISNLNPGTLADPTLLTAATPTPVPSTVMIVGNVLTITKSPSFEGTVLITVIVNDLKGGLDSQAFQMTFAPGAQQAPVLGPIGNQASAAGATDLVVNLTATDANNDPLTFTVTLATQETVLDQQLDLSVHPQGLFPSVYGGGENWLFSFSSNKWYYILPNEELYEWDNTPFTLSGTLIAQLNPGTHANPVLLADAAANPAPVPATATIAGNVLTITRNAGFFGTVVATVTVSDGKGGQDSETFNATFFLPTPPRSARPSRGSAGYRVALDLALSKDDLLDAATLDELVRGLREDMLRKG